MEPKVLTTVGTRASPAEACEKHRHATAGPLIIPDFLDATTCSRIRAAMDAGVSEPAEILGETIAADDEVRRASHVELDDETMALLDARLDEALAPIGRFFGLSLTEREGASILRYEPGGFFRPHRDKGLVPSWPNAARRRIAAVIFLTTSRDVSPSGTFTGGVLRLFDEDERSAPLDLRSRAGTLVAFDATILHEVTAVRGGTREAIVDWYY